MRLANLDFLSGNVPGGILTLFVLIIFTWFIVWYIYHFSEILIKKRFFSWAIIFTFFWLLIYLIFWFRYPPPKDRIRILLFPGDCPTLTDTFAKLYSAEYMIYDIFRYNLSTENFIIYHPDWPLNIGYWESFPDPDFQKNVTEFTKSDYTLFSTSDSDSTGQGILVRNSANPDTLLVTDLNFSKTGIVSFANKIIHILDNRVSGREFISPPILKNNWDSSSWIYWGYGRLASLKQDLEKAREYFRKCLVSNPEFYPALSGLAKIELDSARIIKKNGGYFQDHLALANGYLYKCKQLNPLNPESLRLWAEYAILFENFVLAEKYLKESCNLFPYDDLIYVDFTRLHPSRYRDTQFLNEESLFQYAIFLNPLSVAAHFWYGDFLNRNNRIDEAFDLYKGYLSAFPKLFDLQFALGNLYINTQKYSQAKPLFENMLENFPGRSDFIRFNLGVTAYHQGDTLTAKSIFEQIVSDRSNPDAYLYLSEIAEKRGDLDLAIYYLRKRIRENRGQNDPYKEEARRHLIVLLNRIENSSK